MFYILKMKFLPNRVTNIHKGKHCCSTTTPIFIMQHHFHHSVCFFLTQSDGHRSVGGGGCHVPPRDVTDDERTVPPCHCHEWGCYVYVLVLTLRIDTGDTAWYVMVALKGLFLNNCSKYIFML